MHLWTGNDNLRMRHKDDLIANDSFRCSTHTSQDSW